MQGPYGRGEGCATLGKLCSHTSSHLQTAGAVDPLVERDLVVARLDDDANRRFLIEPPRDAERRQSQTPPAEGLSSTTTVSTSIFTPIRQAALTAIGTYR